MQETKVKKFIYKGQYLDVELNETNELYDIYNDMFKKDFFNELSYLRKRNEKLENLILISKMMIRILRMKKIIMMKMIVMI